MNDEIKEPEGRPLGIEWGLACFIASIVFFGIEKLLFHFTRITQNPTMAGTALLASAVMNLTLLIACIMITVNAKNMKRRPRLWLGWIAGAWGVLKLVTMIMVLSKNQGS